MDNAIKYLFIFSSFATPYTHFAWFLDREVLNRYDIITEERIIKQSFISSKVSFIESVGNIFLFGSLNGTIFDWINLHLSKGYSANLFQYFTNEESVKFILSNDITMTCSIMTSLLITVHFKSRKQIQKQDRKLLEGI